jgi:hypothetical protein
MLNKPNPRLEILRAQTAREKFAQQNARELYAHSAANPRTTHHYHPDYDADLAEWLKSLGKKAAPLGELQKAVTPVKPSASAWRRGTDIPVSERVGLWHVQQPAPRFGSDAKNACKWHFDETSRYRPAAPGTNEYDKYDESRYATADLSARLADAVGAASGAAMAGLKLKHSVCIKAHGMHVVGNVVMGGSGEPFRLPGAWLACDKDGWIPHTPTADSTCPVPSGLKYEYRLRRGDCHVGGVNPACWLLGVTGAREPNSVDVVAWRPVAGGAA